MQLLILKQVQLCLMQNLRELKPLDFVIGQDFRQVGLLKNPQVDSAGHGGQ